MGKKNVFKGYSFTFEEDPNYPDNLNISFNKPSGDWCKEDTKQMKKLVKKLELDPEPIMDGMYSFDRSFKNRIKSEIESIGMVEKVETNTYVPDLTIEAPEQSENPIDMDKLDIP